MCEKTSYHHIPKTVILRHYEDAMYKNIDAQNAHNSSNRANNRLSTPTFLFDGYVIIALHQEWIEKFNTLPTIEASIDDEGHLCLKTMETIRNG